MTRKIWSVILPILLFVPFVYGETTIDETLILETEAEESTDSIENNLLIIPPLFEYVVAPEDLPDLQSRTDYIMENFWNPFDFEKNNVVDQTALNHAFEVYASAIPFASEKKVMDSVKNLIKNIKRNPGLTFQFTKAAEEILYGPRASFWADDIYLMFLQNLVDNKQISDSKKKKYKKQYDLISSTSKGKTLPSVNVRNKNGVEISLNSPKEFKLIEFAEPDKETLRYSNLKLDISSKVNDLILDDRLDVIVVLLTQKNETSDFDFPSKWLITTAQDLDRSLDIRIFPSFYLLDKDSKIIGKNLSIDDAIEILEEITK